MFLLRGSGYSAFLLFGKSWRKNEAVQMDSKENRAAEGSPPTLPLNNL